MARLVIGAGRDLPLDLDESWDGPAARASILAWAASDSGIDPVKARQGFMFYDADAPTLSNSYKLPFATVKDGVLTAVRGGIENVGLRLLQDDHVSGEDRTLAWSALEAYRASWSGDNALPSDDAAVYGFPGRVLRFADAQDEPAEGTDAAALLQVREAAALDVARANAPDPTIFEEHPPYFWGAEISNDRLDDYFTRMMGSSLRNYALDAEEGRAFQLSHNRAEVPWGYSVGGRYHAGQRTGVKKVNADFYTIPGLGSQAGSMRSDDLIARIRSGLLRDVSIGFKGGRYICSIDGADMRIASWAECSHMPGMTYDVGEGKQKQAVLCWAGIEDAVLREVSGAYDGATPGAMINRARSAIEDGRISRRQVDELQVRWSVPDLAPNRIFPAAAPQTIPERSDPVADKNGSGNGEVRGEALELRVGQPVLSLDVLRASVRAVGFTVADTEEDPTAIVRMLTDEVTRLRPLAKLGETYRADLVTETLAQGVRAFDKDFDEQENREMLEALPIEQVKRLRDAWRKTADGVLVPGRVTKDATNGSGETAGREKPPLTVTRA
jgi:hypothetical protein